MIQMDEELEEIKKKKLEELKNIYITGVKNMETDLPNKPLTVTDKDINESIKKYDFFVIDCWASWCSPCRMVSPIIEQLAKEMHGRIVFGKLNVDENPETSIKHQIMSIPTFLIFKKGNLIDRLIGAYPKEELKKKLQLYQ